ncbi:hypothetical protein GON03_20780 [Nocardioides sp. MAH-18]|uniref:Uncharacterized protein n=1 Tax=Nocardioides agri TaxID=2682843 RepID=A0A6L6XXV3_9ACTN|nr:MULTISPECIES: hypothetical protein [unclassified Nocardioides]MBA2952460.1 hypothetical protein [Nocardioides sp. CGMCC 1.13656]MVQ51622.1 hypothetical protein [Nocardioides sp. MAH-18]
MMIDTETTVPPTTTPPRPLRRIAIGVAGSLAAALPTVWTVSMIRFLATGELSGHRYHQLTGQGLLLTTLWLLAVVPLIGAAWRGRRPSSAAGILHLAFVGTGAGCAAAATGGGAPALMVVVAVTGGLLWLALPRRPLLRLPVRVDPVLMPLALVTGALCTPYVLDQIDLQNAASGHHAQNPHYFDMAWLVCTLVVIAVAAAAVPAVRRLGVLAGAGFAWTGAMGLLLDVDRTWSGLVLVAGAVIALVSARPGRG